MRMLKIICFALCVLLLLGCFTGCSNDNKKAKSEKKSTTTKTEQTYKTSGNDKILIGSTGPLTGDSIKYYGIAVKNAAKMAVDEINAAGGVNGEKLDFIMMDDALDADKAVQIYDALKNRGIQIFMGTVTSGACMEVIEQTYKDNIFQLIPTASSYDVIRYDNSFQVCYADPNQGKAAADYIAEHSLASKVAVIYDSSSSYSQGLLETFVKRAGEKGINVVAQESFTSESNTDFSSQIKNAKAKGADLVFLPIYYSEALEILQQAKDEEYAPIFFGCDGFDGILSMEGFDKSLVENVMFLTQFAADEQTEATQNFVKAYKEKFGKIPNQFAAEAYDGIYIIAKCIENGNITADMSAEDICEIMKKEIVSLKFDGVTGENMEWNDSGEVSKTPKAIIIRNGQYVFHK